MRRSDIEISDLGAEIRHLRIIEPIALQTIPFDECRIARLDDKFFIILLQYVLCSETNEVELQAVARLSCASVTFPRLLLREALSWCGDAFKRATGILMH